MIMTILINIHRSYLSQYIASLYHSYGNMPQYIVEDTCWMNVYIKFFCAIQILNLIMKTFHAKTSSYEPGSKVGWLN